MSSAEEALADTSSEPAPVAPPQEAPAEPTSPYTGGLPVATPSGGQYHVAN
jgi:hypothetical protein